MKKTTITISDELWIKLNSFKKSGDTFEDVIKRMLPLEKSNESLSNDKNLN